MPARAIGSATISFGLVSIPVKLYTATQASAGVSFNLLHKKCHSRLKQQYICQKDHEIVPREEMVKGFEFAKDQYVTFTPEELEALEEKATQSIDITEFVPAAKVDPIFFEKSYYLGPDKGGDRAYKLLARAMAESGKSALAKYAARGKMYLVLVRAVGERLIMQQLYYANEVRDMTEVPVGDAEPKDAELKLALALLEQNAHETFDPSQYEDEVRQRIEEAIQRKVEGQEVSLAPVEAPSAQIIDLMEALKASLSQKPAGGATPAKEAADSSSEERRPAKRAAKSAEEVAPTRSRRAASAKGDKK